MTIIALLASGLTVKYNTSGLADSIPVNINLKLRDIKFTVPMSNIASSVGQVNGLFNDIKSAMKKEIERTRGFDFYYFEDTLTKSKVRPKVLAWRRLFLIF